MRTAKYCLIFQNHDKKAEELDTKQCLQTQPPNLETAQSFYQCQPLPPQYPTPFQYQYQPPLYQQPLYQPYPFQATPHAQTQNLTSNEILIRRDLDELRNLIVNMKPPNPAPTPSVVQNMEPVTVAHIEAMALEHLDISDIEEGIDGIVDFTVQYPLQGRVICIDKARRKFRYTDEHGNIVNDFGGLQLSKTVFTGIQARCVQLIDQRYAELAADIKIAVEANRGYEDAVLANMVTSTELQNLKQSLIDAAKGAENELQKGYIRKLVKELK